MSSTASASYSWTDVDIAKVVRRVHADLTMIAQNSGAITEDKARQYAEDIELLAKKGFLKKVDIALLSYGQEVQAVVYTVNKEGGGLTPAAPGGLYWPVVGGASLQLNLVPTPEYTAQQKQTLMPQLNISWAPSSDDISHSKLQASGGRDYMSNGYAMQRQDYSK